MKRDYPIRLRLNSRGSSIVDYLMITAVVSAVVVPIILNKFGAPLIKTMTTERQKLVNFVGQTPRGRKPPVPSSWFSQEKVAKSGGQELGTPGQLPPGAELNGTGSVGGAGTVGGSDLAQVKDLKDPQQLQTGNLGNTGNVGGGGALGSGQGGPAGGDDFFSKPATPPGATLGGQDEKSGIAAGSGGGGNSGSEGRSSSREQPGSESLMGETKKTDAQKEQASGGIDQKKRSFLAENAEKEERSRSEKFDWWTLIKILIVIFILALLFLIALGNTRRGGGS